MDGLRALGILVWTAGLAACGDDAGTGGGGSGGGGASGGSGGSGGADVCLSETTPPPPPTEPCDRMPGGPPGARSTAVDLSSAHELVRFFAPVTNVDQADQALVTGLASGAALAMGDLSDYAAALPGVACAHPAATASLGPAVVAMQGTLAFVTPGTGAVVIPPEATAVVVDLRSAPDDPGLRAALEAAVGPALGAEVPRLVIRVREHDGLVDEVFSANNVYTQKITNLDQAPIPATGTADLPIALLTGPVLAPEAAAFAIHLRAANRAFVVGEDLRADVAESRWRGVSGGGVYVRTGALRNGSAILGDVVPADRRSTAPECVVADVLAAGAPAPLANGAANRPSLDKLAPFDVIQPEGESLEEAQAALIVAHAALRRFFPYFPVVGDGIDARLDETLAALAPPLDRPAFRNALRRFGEVIHDGHNFVFNDGTSFVAGYAPVMIEDIAGEPVVRRTTIAGVAPGDAIIAVDGVPIADFYATELARTSAATPGYQYDIATRELIRLQGPVTWDLRDPDGVVSSVVVTPQPLAAYQALGSAPSQRPAGFLTDLGAPTVYYINLSGEVLDMLPDFTAAMTAAQGATGLVIDMRGYPGIDHYAAAQRLVDVAFSSPVFRVTYAIGPDATEVDESSYPLMPMNPFTGPIALIVGHHTVSAAENFSTMLVDAGVVTVVGRNSAGTNGNITGVNLPGAFSFTFTGMDVRHADGAKSVFHGVGIVPVSGDTPMLASDFRDGIDPEILDAIAALP